MVLHGKFTCVQIPLSNYCTQDFRYLHAMHRCEQTAQSLNILFRLAPPCMHVMAAQEYEVSFLSVSLSLSLSHVCARMHTHTSAIIFSWLQQAVLSSASPQETLLERGGRLLKLI